MKMLLGGVCLLLVLGGFSGHASRLVHSSDDDRAKTWGTRWPLVAAVIAALAVIFLAVQQLVVCGGANPCRQVVTVLKLPGPGGMLPPLNLTLRLDSTAAIFLLLVGTCGACIALYSLGWLRDDPLRNRVAGSFDLFLLAMIFVILVCNIFWLFVGLEIMTFCSGDLVRYRGAIGGPVEASRTAVRTYLIVSHIGMISLLVGVLPIVVAHHSLGMMAVTHHFHAHPAGSPAPAFSFSFILLGLAIRAGVTPFHFWVPVVHPQLPTNTHAMVSAVMLKIPVYLMLRFFLGGIVGPVRWWWGVVILVLAGLTAVVTVFYALLAADLKVALAYHSVENIGIILAGLGLALLFKDPRFAHDPAVRDAAALALLASLYHVLNHGLFKSLLFLCVGSIERQTGTVELRWLGGLCRTLPWTAFTFLIGAAAIAELPPFNGFVSGWLTLQALFGGNSVYLRHQKVTLVIVPAVLVALIALALALGTTALAFVKMTGQSLLGEPRGKPSVRKEPWSMRTVMVLLASLCLLLGLQPWLLMRWLAAALEPLRMHLAGVLYSSSNLALHFPRSHHFPGYRATLPMMPLLLLVAAAVGLTALLRAWRWTRRPVWVGGAELDPVTMQYSANAVSALLWEPMSRWRREPAVTRSQLLDAAAPDDGESATTYQEVRTYREELLLSPRRLIVELASFCYNRLISRITAVSDRIGHRIQDGDVRSYLLYMLVVVLLVLSVLAVMR